MISVIPLDAIKATRPAIRRRYSGAGSGCVADTATRRWRSSPRLDTASRV